eukprot:1195474-Prorocentrum_minimum.AAC.1
MSKTIRHPPPFVVFFFVFGVGCAALGPGSTDTNKRHEQKLGSKATTLGLARFMKQRLRVSSPNQVPAPCQ